MKSEALNKKFREALDNKDSKPIILDCKPARFVLLKPKNIITATELDEGEG